MKPENYQELDDDQRRVYLDTVQLYDAVLETEHMLRSVRGGMHWKTVKGHDYLIRRLDSRRDTSLGPRSPETEAVMQSFLKKKEALKERSIHMKKGLDRQAALCKALRLGRMPRVAAEILRAAPMQSLSDKTLTVIGTHALYAYEALAGAQFRTDLLATRDIDLLWDTRARIRLAGDMPARGLLAILRSVDKSFEMMQNAPFRAVNQDGFMVDLLRQARGVEGGGPVALGPDDPFQAAEAFGLDWLLAAPKRMATVIDTSGHPVRMCAPDPRAFAIHKFWVSRRPDRDPVKVSRDRSQALAVVDLVQTLLPQWPFADEALRMFPQTLRTSWSKPG